jgi:hypothetical protein
VPEAHGNQRDAYLDTFAHLPPQDLEDGKRLLLVLLACHPRASQIPHAICWPGCRRGLNEANSTTSVHGLLACGRLKEENLSPQETVCPYACVLPTPTPSQMDCSSTTQEPMRQTCDAFLEIGPHSEHSSNHSIFTIYADFDVSVPLLDTAFTISLSAEPLLRLDTPIHPSIQTTVLRI